MISQLYSAITIEGAGLKNRIGLAPLNTGLFRSDGAPRSRCLPFYEQYAESGIALLVVGGIAVSENGRANGSSLALTSPERTSGIAAVIALSKERDVAVAVQLEHAGRQADPEEIGCRTVAPSAVPCPVVGAIPHALSVAEIGEVTANFADAAAYAAAAGADFVEIHAAHGYLLSEFLSPYANRRIDSYGGSVHNRFRILREVVSAIGARCTIPIGLRINCTDNVLGGMELSDMIDGLRGLHGSVAYVSISAGFYSRDNDIIMPPRSAGRALWRVQGRAVRETLRIPVMLAGNIDTPELADELIAEGSADVALFGRALLSDPQLLRKWSDGQSAAVQPCTYCGLCKYHSWGREHIFCPFNPILAPRSGS